MNRSENDQPSNYEPPKKRNRTSLGRRSRCLSCLDRLKLMEYQQRLDELKQMQGYSTSSSSNSNNTEISFVEYRINKLLNKSIDIQKNIRVGCVQMLATVDGAEEYLGNRFETLIGFTPDEIREISSTIYYSSGRREFIVKNNKNRHCASILFEELIMTLAMRHRYNLRTFAAIAIVSGRDESLLSLMVRNATQYLLDRFGWTLELAFVQRYRLCVGQWNQAIASKYEEKSGLQWSDLPVSFQEASVILDGTRIEIRRPMNKDHQKRVYSGYTKSHNFITLGVLAPNGIYIATSPLIPGSTNDAAAVAAVDLPAFLDRDLRTSCLCDAVFKFEHRMLSLRGALCDLHILNMQQLKALRGIRTSVEHGFSLIKQWFPFVECGSLKLEENAPGLITKAAFLLFNIKSCLRGNNIGEQFKVLPPTLKEYLDIPNE